MSGFVRQPARCDVPSLRLVRERQELRDAAERNPRQNPDFYFDKSLTGRVTRVVEGARETVRVAWKRWAG